MPNSLLPLPNPLVTSPCNLIGYGVSGPASGPARSGREDMSRKGNLSPELAIDIQIWSLAFESFHFLFHLQVNRPFFLLYLLCDVHVWTER